MWNLKKPLGISITPGFLLLIGTLLYLDQGVGILIWGILAAVCHEFGHILASRRFGGRVQMLSLTVTGAELRFIYPHLLSYGAESLIALAGPAANLLVGAVSLCLHSHMIAMTNLAVGLFNLSPILPMDGGRILSNLLCEWTGIPASERITSASAGIFLGILFGLGLIAAVHSANMMLLILTGWLLLGTLRKNNIFLRNN